MTASASLEVERVELGRRAARVRPGRSSLAERDRAPPDALDEVVRSASPACSVMTCPSSAPSSRTSSASGSRAPRRADARRLRRPGRRGATSRPCSSARSGRRGTATQRATAAATFRGRNRSYPCKVMAVAPQPEVERAGPPRRAARTAAAPAEVAARSGQLDQLRFLHDVARLATTARTWDELLETVVDGTRDALHADVSSLYLLDRDGAYLTLAATNGLDRFQIGRARVPFGEGVTGSRRRQPAAAGHPRRQGRPALPVGPRHRPAPVRRLDAERAADLARPDRRRAQRPDRASRASFSAVRRRPARAPSPTCWPGIVEKGRQQSEAEARVEALKAIDEARSELIALVTHELRTPLAVVRAYADLLAEEPTLGGPRVARHRAARDARRLARRDARADRAPRPAGRLDPGLGPGRARGCRRGRAGRRRGARRRGPRSR